MDDRQAAWWYRLAAAQGHADAQCNLGVMYASGRGVAQDDREAVKWYRLAAEQGDREAQFLLGMAYNLGRGVPRNLEESQKWYRRMAVPQGGEKGAGANPADVTSRPAEGAAAGGT